MQSLIMLILQQGHILKQIYQLQFIIDGKYCTIKDYFDLKRKVSSDLEAIASKIQKLVQNTGIAKVIGGACKLQSALLAGLSLVMAPATGGASILVIGSLFGIGGSIVTCIAEKIKQSGCDEYLKQLQMTIKKIQKFDNAVTILFNELSTNLQMINKFMRENKQSFGDHMESLSGSQDLKEMSRPIRLIINENIKSLLNQNNMQSIGVNCVNLLLLGIPKIQLNLLNLKQCKTIYLLSSHVTKSIFNTSKSFFSLFGKILSKGGQILSYNGKILSQGGQILSYSGKILSQGGQIFGKVPDYMAQGAKKIADKLAQGAKQVFNKLPNMLQILQKFLIIVGIGINFYQGIKDVWEGLKDMSSSQISNELRSCKKQYDITTTQQEKFFNVTKDLYDKMLQYSKLIAKEEQILKQKIQQKKRQLERQKQQKIKKLQKLQKEQNKIMTIKIVSFVLLSLMCYFIFSGTIFSRQDQSQSIQRAIFTIERNQGKEDSEQQKEEQKQNQQNGSGGNNYQDKENQKEGERTQDDKSQDNRKPNKNDKNSKEEVSQIQKQKKDNLIRLLRKIIQLIKQQFKNPKQLKVPNRKRQNFNFSKKQQFKAKHDLKDQQISIHHIYPGSSIVNLIQQVSDQSLAIIFSDYLLHNEDLYNMFMQNYQNIHLFLAGRIYWNPPNLVLGPSQIIRANDPGQYIDWEILSTKSLSFQKIFEQMIKNLGNPENKSIPGLNVTRGFEIYLNLQQEQQTPQWRQNNQTKYQVEKK